MNMTGIWLLLKTQKYNDHFSARQLERAHSMNLAQNQPKSKFSILNINTESNEMFIY